MDMLKTGAFAAAGSLAALTFNAGGVKAADFLKPSPTFPENNPVTVVQSREKAASLFTTPSPTNPKPPFEGDQVNNKSQPVLLAQREPSQVAQGEERSNTRREEPSPQSGNGAQIFLNLSEEARRGQEALTDKLRNLPPPPGSKEILK